MEIVCREVIYRLRKITFLQAQSRVCLSFLQNQWWLEAMVHQIFGQSVKIHDIPIKQWRFAKLFVSLNLRIISWNQFYSNILYYRSFFHGNFSIKPWIMVHDTRILWYTQCTMPHCGKMKNLLSPNFFPVKSTLEISIFICSMRCFHENFAKKALE